MALLVPLCLHREKCIPSRTVCKWYRDASSQHHIWRRVNIHSTQSRLSSYALYLFPPACITCKTHHNGQRAMSKCGLHTVLTGSCDPGSLGVGCACVLVHVAGVGRQRLLLQWLVVVVYILHNPKSTRTERRGKGHFFSKHAILLLQCSSALD